MQELFFASKHWKYYAKAGVSAPVGRSLRPSLKMASRSLMSAALEAGAELVRSWAGVSAPPESPHPQAGVSAPLLPVSVCPICRHNQMRVRSGSGGTPEFPHGPESPHSQGGVSAPNFSGMLVGAGRQPQKSIRSFAGVSAPVRSLRTGSAETPH